MTAAQEIKSAIGGSHRDLLRISSAEHMGERELIGGILFESVWGLVLGLR